MVQWSCVRQRHSREPVLVHYWQRRRNLRDGPAVRSGCLRQPDRERRLEPRWNTDVWSPTTAREHHRAPGPGNGRCGDMVSAWRARQPPALSLQTLIRTAQARHRRCNSDSARTHLPSQHRAGSRAVFRLGQTVRCLCSRSHVEPCRVIGTVVANSRIMKGCRQVSSVLVQPLDHALRTAGDPQVAVDTVQAGNPRGILSTHAAGRSIPSSFRSTQRLLASLDDVAPETAQPHPDVFVIEKTGGAL